MMPTPPTTSEIMATHSSRLVISLRRGGQRVGHLGHVADVEVVRLARADVVALAQQRGDLVDGRRDLVGAAGRDQDLVDVGEAHRQRGVRPPGWPTARGRGWAAAGVEVAQRVDRAARPRRLALWLALLQARAGDAVLDRRPGGQDDVVLVHAHHVGALAAEHADDAERDVLDADLLADRRRRPRTARGRASGRAGRPCCALQHVALGEGVALGQRSSRGRRGTPGWCRRWTRGPSCGCRRRPGRGRGRPGRRSARRGTRAGWPRRPRASAS